MTDRRFGQVVASEAELRGLMGEPSELARRKQIARLDVHCRALIAHSPFLLMATADAAGRCDVSPKGDAPGFVLVLDDTHLAVPDRPGNKRLDGMLNILRNPHVGLIFLVPGMEETLRVNGRATIVRDEELLQRLSAHGKRPRLAVVVEVEECFLHCAKAMKRSGLWQPDRWPDRSALPTAARIFLDHARPDGFTVDGLDQRLQDGYRTGLY